MGYKMDKTLRYLLYKMKIIYKKSGNYNYYLLKNAFTVYINTFLSGIKVNITTILLVINCLVIQLFKIFLPILYI